MQADSLGMHKLQIPSAYLWTESLMYKGGAIAFEAVTLDSSTN